VMQMEAADAILKIKKAPAFSRWRRRWWPPSGGGKPTASPRAPLVLVPGCYSTVVDIYKCLMGETEEAFSSMFLSERLMGETLVALF